MNTRRSAPSQRAGPLSAAVESVGSMAGVVEVDPERCPKGHELGPNRVINGWLPCLRVEGRTGQPAQSGGPRRLGFQGFRCARDG